MLDIWWQQLTVRRFCREKDADIRAGRKAMIRETAIKLFEPKKVRSVWDGNKG